MEFTGLERAVLAAICREHPSVGGQLRGLLETARLSERKNTGHGFYTRFNVDRLVPPVVWPEPMAPGPNCEVAVGGETLLMGFILWLDAGYPVCLEGFQYGTPSGEDIDLQREDLSVMAWIRQMS